MFPRASGGITAASLASNTITAAKIATDAIGAAQLAADAVTEIQSGLATSSALTTVGSNVTAVKAKTDSLTFTVTGEVDANTKSMNDATVLGDGTSGDKWRGE